VVDTPQDFVVATGTSTTVKEFVQFSFERVGLDWEKHVRFDERYLRPTEVDALIGDATKSREELGWAAKTSPKELAELMVDSDLAALDAGTNHWVDKVTWRY
jgi:GDPmannose 4,6-dehydratase